LASKHTLKLTLITIKNVAYYTNDTCIFLLPQYTAFTIYSYQLAADKLTLTCYLTTTN